MQVTILAETDFWDIFGILLRLVTSVATLWLAIEVSKLSKKNATQSAFFNLTNSMNESHMMALSNHENLEPMWKLTNPEDADTEGMCKEDYITHFGTYMTLNMYQSNYLANELGLIDNQFHAPKNLEAFKCLVKKKTTQEILATRGYSTAFVKYCEQYM